MREIDIIGNRTLKRKKIPIFLAIISASVISWFIFDFICRFSGLLR